MRGSQTGCRDDVDVSRNARFSGCFLPPRISKDSDRTTENHNPCRNSAPLLHPFILLFSVHAVKALNRGKSRPFSLTSLRAPYIICLPLREAVHPASGGVCGPTTRPQIGSAFETFH